MYILLSMRFILGDFNRGVNGQTIFSFLLVLFKSAIIVVFQ